ncbi:DUF1501 domain-containing protein [Fundidesulfovibrio soli]|uniref:DUF1501 domain-containing protein n=1 Tax=Fundidesulfovibrio soli TaxID=2922716 RepID=UPI001FAF2C92|nr:DUF1501 domain-containing protein [Fundidesulfovibrio soli]
MRRRQFLAAGATTALASLLPLGLGSDALAQGGESKRLIVIFLRGGLDGLSALPPQDDPIYCRCRPRTAIPPAGQEGGALALAPGFGLHPALEPLLEPWKAGLLAFVPACGLPTPLRSHPEAQKAMESGNPREPHVRDGFFARLLPLLGPGAKGLTLSPSPPIISQGRPGFQQIKPTGFPPPLWRIERPEAFTSFDAIYGKAPEPWGRNYRQAQIVLKNRLTEMDREMTAASSGAPSVHALPDMAGKIVAYLGQNPATRLVYAAFGGIDAHFDQGAAKGRLADALASIGKGVAALAKALGPDLKDTMVLVMSEFGRSLRENEYGGTENGHGTVLMALGGPTAGGALHGAWPGLSPEKLSDGLDLAVTVDYREVLAGVVTAHFGLGLEAVAQALPGYTPDGSVQPLFRRG